MSRIKIRYFFRFMQILLQQLSHKLKQKYILTRNCVDNPSCRFYSGVEFVNSIAGNYCVFFQNVIAINSKFGDHSYVQRNSRIINTTVGKFCSIAADVSIGPGLHKTDGISTHPAFFLCDTPLVRKFLMKDEFVPTKPTKIDHDVWIGEKVVVIDGVEIGTGAIVASGAVVTRNVPPYSIVGGIPARVLKYRFEDETVKKLLASRWWEMSDEMILERSEFFSRPEMFVSEIRKR